jgi:plastocyanin
MNVGKYVGFIVVISLVLTVFVNGCSSKSAIVANTATSQTTSTTTTLSTATTATPSTATTATPPTTTTTTPPQITSTDTPPPTKTFSGTADVSIGDDFDPSVLIVTVGTTVTWTNNDGEAHSVTSDVWGLFDFTLLNIGDTCSYTFTKAGTYIYSCREHSWMVGKIIVK